MKLSELSKREYIAIEALSVLRHISDISPETLAEETAKRAYLIADAMLKQTGLHEDRVKHAEDRAAQAETKFETLQSIHVNMGEGFGARIALTDIWELLGVNNQTAAMEKLVKIAWKVPQ